MRLKSGWSVLLALFALAPLAAGVAAQQRTLCVHGIEAPDTLNVRAGPGYNHRVVDRFPAKACGVELRGRCVEGWCEMALGQTAGWVHTKHIGVYETPGVGPGTPLPEAQAAATPPAARAAAAVPVQPPSVAPEARGAKAPEARGEKLAEARPVIVQPERRQAAIVRAPPRPVREQGSADPGACVTGVDRGDTLRIRTGPGVDNDEIGGIPPGACGVARAGSCRGNWCKIAWRGRVGWVNTSYLD